ncbi:MAG: 50S ribosome-binding GTPase [Xanthobacteraceae bacterium]|nr:50S ribosome-binding GTPase [Xanthobacteraceae bacterium]QYK45558.1 MAG: 50S ribosome-binding GTPase [Xanthobacteraceae bacterium]
MGVPSLQELRSGGKAALARALAAIETEANSQALAALLDEACAHPKAHVIGLTGTPGVGKSTLINAMISRARTADRTIAIIAVDPSSKATRGALLGDRARMTTNPDDKGVFVRSMAARDRLGGISNETIAAAVLMRALYDIVIVETVGVGQSESDIASIADTVLLCIQPGAGDSLQFMKAGVMELPDVIAVTKGDMGAAARRARADVEGALGLSAHGEWTAPVVVISASTGDGLDALDEAMGRHLAFLDAEQRRAKKRHEQEAAWVAEAIRARFGSEGLDAAGTVQTSPGGPFTRELRLAGELRKRLFPLTGK